VKRQVLNVAKIFSAQKGGKIYMPLTSEIGANAAHFAAKIERKAMNFIVLISDYWIDGLQLI